MREEFDALGFGQVFDRRGAATDEAIKILRAAWTTQGDVSFEGEVYRFQPVRMLPKPARPGGVPIWIGGHGRRSIRRAAELGDGWHPLRIPVDEVRPSIDYLHEQLRRYGRRPEDVILSMGLTVWPPGGGPEGEPQEWELAGDPDACAEKLRRYQAVGITDFLIGASRGSSANALLEAIEFVAREVRPRAEAM
jgi:alkanesulfonate monooxygenase SsuD/methylene tetrahydromethanopterin reductase-like flavin-dependent oxidoreductase (luciferase family)